VHRLRQGPAYQLEIGTDDYFWENVDHEDQTWKGPDRKKATSCLDMVTNLGRDKVPVWQIQGLLLRLLDRNEEAIEACDRVLALESDNTDSRWPTLKLAAGDWRTRGMALAGLNRNEEALKAFDLAVDLESDDPTAWEGKARVLASPRRDKEALEAQDRAINLQRYQPEA
jgi:tetratricopeptide (TPR) repeat protein